MRRLLKKWRVWQYERKLVSLQMLKLFARIRPDAYFIQIGSNDGEQLDPLRFAILHYAWRGIMIEPVPYVFERLRANYGRYAQRITLENVAIADREGELPFYHLAQVDDYEKAKLPRWYDALGSFKKEVVLKHVNYIPDIAERTVCTQIRCTTFDALCRKNNVQQLDLLHMDTEGYDFELLKLIDFTRWRPRIVIYEHLHLGEADRAASRAYLAQHGYEFAQENMDTFCFNTRDLPDAEQPLLRLWQRMRRA